jgi:signal transduction histidine kinase
MAPGMGPMEKSSIKTRKRARAWDKGAVERRRDDRLWRVGASRLRLLDYACTHSLDEVLQATLDEAEALTGSRIGFYHFIDDDGKSLVLQNWSTRTKAEFCQAEGKGLHYGLDDAGVWADCVRLGRPVVHNDYASLPNKRGLPPGHAELRRELVVPVRRGDHMLAILGVGNSAEPYDEDDIDTIVLLADLAWDIAERKRSDESRAEAERALRALNQELEERVKERSAEVEQAARLAFLGRLVASIAHEISTPLAAIASANASLGSAMAECIPGLPFFLEGQVEGSRELFRRLVVGILSGGAELPEAEARRRARRWRAIARSSQAPGAESTAGMLAEIGCELSDEELRAALALPGGPAVVEKAFTIARSVRASSLIKIASEKAARTIRALKAYAHGAPSDRFENVDLNGSLDGVLELYFSDPGSKLKIMRNYCANSLAICQPDRTAQVWVNILTNAVQAVSQEGRVEIATREEAGFVVTEISDDGPGIPEESRPKLFTPFFTTKGPGEGLGLGLDTCKRIVEEAGGRISYESRPGRTTFKVSLIAARPT